MSLASLPSATGDSKPRVSSPTAPSYRDVIRKVLATVDDADPHVISEHVMRRLSKAQQQELVAEGVAEAVRYAIRLERRSLTCAEQNRDAQGPSRLEIAMRGRAFVPGKGWMFEIDMSVADLLAVADDYAAQARAIHEKAQRYRDLAREVQDAGCGTVGELLERREAA